MVAIHNKNERITDFPAHQHNNFIVLDFACENVKESMGGVSC